MKFGRSKLLANSEPNRQISIAFVTECVICSSKYPWARGSALVISCYVPIPVVSNPAHWRLAKLFGGVLFHISHISKHSMALKACLIHTNLSGLPMEILTPQGSIGRGRPQGEAGLYLEPPQTLFPICILCNCNIR